MAYSPTSWKRGDIITAEKLNKVETGLQAVASVDIQSAQATTLAAGAPATAVIEGGVLKLGIPRGQTGAQGAAGAQGAKGDKGDTGAQGAKGETGATPTITATATVDATVGTPKVTVSKGAHAYQRATSLRRRRHRAGRNDEKALRDHGGEWWNVLYRHRACNASLNKLFGGVAFVMSKGHENSYGSKLSECQGARHRGSVRRRLYAVR